MSWPSYSGGGPVNPQQSQNNGAKIQNQLLQMMQLQMQVQHNIKLRKQQEFNPPKSKLQNKPDKVNEDTDNNYVSNNETTIKAGNLNDPDNGQINQEVNEGESKDKNSQSLSESINNQSNKSTSVTKNNLSNSFPTDSAYYNKREPMDPKLNVQPPSARDNIFNNAKISLMEIPPSLLLPNQPPPPPPPPLPQTLPPEPKSKDSYSESQLDYYQNQSDYSIGQQGSKDYQQYQHDYQQEYQQSQQNYQLVKPGYQQSLQDSANPSQQDYNTNLPHNRPNKPAFNNTKQNHVEDYQYRDTYGGDSFGISQGGGTRWQNDMQNQKDFTNYNAYQGPGGTDYSRGANQTSIGNIHQSDYVQHNQYSRNMNVGSEKSTKQGPSPYAKREQPRGFYGAGVRLKDKFESAFTGPLTDLAPLDISEKKFNFYAKVFVGNIPKNAEEDELLALFNSYGEIGQIYINKDSSFGFITFDYKANAAKAVRAVDNQILKGRHLKVRFAMINEGIRIKNLSPYISNELLEKAFSVFGTIESCRALVDDRGNPKFEGIIVFKEKRSAALALKACQEDCFYLSGAMRPVIVVPLEPCEDNVEGYPESAIIQNEEYLEERKVTPHIADPNSFEFEFGNQWKKLYAMYDEKKSTLDKDFQIELERLEKKMVLAKVEYETDKLRRELAEQEAKTAQLRKSFGTESFAERQASPAQYPEARAASNAFEGIYGKMDSGYEAGYDANYSGDYGNMPGYGKSNENIGHQGSEYDGMYGQQSRGYGSGYGGEEYGQTAPEDGYGNEPVYDHSIVSNSTPEANRPLPPLPPAPPAPPARVKYDYEAYCEPPPSFTNSPEPSLAEKDPYQVSSKRQRY